MVLLFWKLVTKGKKERVRWQRVLEELAGGCLKDEVFIKRVIIIAQINMII